MKRQRPLQIIGGLRNHPSLLKTISDLYSWFDTRSEIRTVKISKKDSVQFYKSKIKIL